jgi:uncharacterized protein YbdZ (MbtH family)
MPDKWGLAAMSHVNDPGNTTQDAFTVVVNGAGQYSLSRAPATAVIAQGTQLTYGQLDKSASKIGPLVATGYLSAPRDIRLPAQRTGSQAPDRSAHAD